MKEKCTKYESLFIFGTEQDLAAHLEVCSDCKAEHEKMHKVSNLVKEVKPLYNRNTGNNKILLKFAACFIIMIGSFFAYNGYNNKMIAELNYESEILVNSGHSIITDTGLPTDEYGLIAAE
jgi:hypothetical protein